MTDDVLALAADAPIATREDWLAAVEKALKGGSLDRLVSTTPDGVRIEPLYRAEDAPPPVGAPGVAAARGLRAAGTLGGWDVRQVQPHDPDAEAANARILADLEGGVTSIELTLGADTVAALDRILEGVLLDVAGVSLGGGGGGASELLRIYQERGIAADAVHADLGIDPVGGAARTGTNRGVDAQFALAARLVAQVRPYPGVRVLRVDGAIYAEAGAPPADELATMLATLVANLRALDAAGVGAEEVFARTLFALTVGTDQFGDIAKLRALRRVVARVAESVGVGAPAGVSVQATTAQHGLARVDPWVNVLRTTVGCFAAGVGGADIVTVAPYDLDGLEPLGRRVARNTQLIAQLESHLGSVIDPAGGSWYVESLTEALATEAWHRFQQIETEGGILAALESGALQQRLVVARTAAHDALSTRQRSMTGVSEFPNLDEPLPQLDSDDPLLGESDFPRVAPTRLSSGYEQLRVRSARADGAVFLANLGPVATHSARAGFAKNLFETGGIRALGNDGFETPEAVADAFAQSGARLAVLCSSDEVYASLAAPAAAALKRAGAARVYLAGRPGDHRDAYEAAGIDEFVYAGVDTLDTIVTAQIALGSRQVEEGE